MLFSFQADAKAAAFSSVLSLTSARGDTHLCEDDGPFSLTKSTKWHVKAFQLTFSDGTKGPVHGDNTDTEGNDGNWYNVDQKNWNDGDLVTDVHMAANYWGNGDAMGGITMDVAGQKFSVKSDIGYYVGEPQDLAGSLLIRAYGSAGGFVNSFGLVFLTGSVVKSEIVGMNFPQSIDEMNQNQTGVDSVSLGSATYKNPSEAGFGDMPFEFINGQAKTSTRTITTTNSHTFGTSIAIELGAKVGIPAVVESSMSVTATLWYRYQSICSTADMKADAKQITYTQKGTLRSGEGAICTATSMSGSYVTDYTNVINITTSTGKTFTINRPAHFDSVEFTQAQVSCKVMLIKDLPGGGKDAKDVSKQTKRAIGFSA